MPRKAHYWKRPRSTEMPRRVLTIDCETIPELYNPDELKTQKTMAVYLHRLRFAILQYGEIRQHAYREITNETCNTTEQVIATILHYLRRKDRLWLIGHNIAYDLGAANLWGWLFNSGFVWRQKILERGKFLLEGRMNGCPITITDTGNYAPMSLATIGKDLGFGKLEMPPFDAPDDVWHTYCQRDVDITAQYFAALSIWVQRNNYGPFAPTAASLAFNTFRKRFMLNKVLVHNGEDALKLERKAYYGGLVETPIIGKMKDSPIYELDVQSMYPEQCCRRLPYKIAGQESSITIDKLRELMQHYQCFADVTLTTEDYPLPMRGKHRTYHCVGTFRTCLADPELRYALESDKVKKVHFATAYYSAPIFREFMLHFYELKNEYSKRGETAYRTFCKLQMNSLYGKAGQQSVRWVPFDERAMRTLERYYSLSEGALDYLLDMLPKPKSPRWPTITTYPGVIVYTRDFGDGIEVDVGSGESRDSCPAIAATVTSYARMYLRSLQQIAGAGSWFYCDTDSIWTNATGLNRLIKSGFVVEGELGKLGNPTAYKGLIVHGPKDYQPIPYDGDIPVNRIHPLANIAIPEKTFAKMKGISRNAKQIDETTFEQLKFPGPLMQLFGKPVDGVLVEMVRKELKRRVNYANISSSGIVTPYVLPQQQERIK